MNQKIHQMGDSRHVEHPAAGTLFPGMLAEITSTGGVQAHSTAGGVGESMFVQEDALQGGTVAGFGSQSTGSYTGYTVAGRGGVGPDLVMLEIESPGSLSLALLKAGFNYPIGTKLISAGDGTLKPTTGTPAKVYGVVVTALDISASPSVNTVGQIRCL